MRPIVSQVWRSQALAVALSLYILGATLAAAPGVQMLDIPAGVARLGALDGEDDEQPLRQETIAAFRLGRTEVTNAEFAAFVNASAHVTSAERVGWGWVWRAGQWQQIKGTDWRQPHGPMKIHVFPRPTANSRSPMDNNGSGMSPRI